MSKVKAGKDREFDGQEVWGWRVPAEEFARELDGTKVAIEKLRKIFSDDKELLRLAETANGLLSELTESNREILSLIKRRTKSIELSREPKS